VEDLSSEPITSTASPGDTKQSDPISKDDGEGKDQAVRITVHPPELREGKFGGIGSYHTYKVQMVPNEVDHVFRRYKDFEWLRSSLSTWFPCLFIPPLPPKRVFGSLGDKFVADRRADLERFLARCAGMRHLAASPPFKLFMCRATNFDDGTKEIQAKQAERTGATILKEYREIFPDLQGSKAPDDAEKRISALKEFLENSEKKLSVLADDSQNLANTMNTVTAHLSKITTSLDQVYTEEKSFPQRTDPARIDVQENIHQWQLGVKQITPFYETIFAKGFQNELQDIESFLELFKQRDYYVGEQKKLVKKLESSKAANAKKPSAQLQSSIESDTSKEKEFAEIVEAITQLILGHEYQRFWKNRTTAFKITMNTFASEQLGVAKQTVGLWESISTA